MKYIVTLAILLMAGMAQAQPVKYTGWTTNSNSSQALSALGGVANNNGSATNLSMRGNMVITGTGNSDGRLRFTSTTSGADKKNFLITSDNDELEFLWFNDLLNSGNGIGAVDKFGNWNIPGNVTASSFIGNLPIGDFNGGINADNAHFWRGDGTWAVPPGTGSGSATNLTPWQTNIDGNGFSLSNAANVTFTGVASGNGAGLTNIPASGFAIDFTNITGLVSAAQLTNSGTSVGTFNSVTVDSKGRVTSGSNNGANITNANATTTFASGTIPFARLPATLTTNAATISNGQPLIGQGGNGIASTNAAAYRRLEQISFDNQIYVEDYGIYGFRTNNTSGACPTTITDNAAAIQSLLDNAANSNGITLVQFGAGTYRCSTNLWVPPNIVLGGRGYLHRGVGQPVYAETNTFTQLWFPVNSMGVQFYRSRQGNGMKNIEIIGGTNAFVDTATLRNTNYSVGNVGLHVYADAEDAVTSGYNQGFFAENCSIAGFKMAIFMEANDCVLKDVMGQGCDLGYVSLITNFVSEFKTAGLDYYNTNYFNRLTNRDGSQRTSFTQGEMNTLINCGFGNRSNSVCYVLENTRSLMILNDKSYKASEFMWISDSLADVFGTQGEFDEMAHTNYVKIFGVCNLNFYGCKFTGVPGSFCFAKATANATGAGLFGTWDVRFGAEPTWSPSDGGPAGYLYLEMDELTIASVRNMSSSGYVRCKSNASRGDYYMPFNYQSQFTPLLYQFKDMYFDGVLSAISVPWGYWGIQHAMSNSIADYFFASLRPAGSTTPKYGRFIMSDLMTGAEGAANGDELSTNITVGVVRANGMTNFGNNLVQADSFTKSLTIYGTTSPHIYFGTNTAFGSAQDWQINEYGPTRDLNFGSGISGHTLLALGGNDSTTLGYVGTTTTIPGSLTVAQAGAVSGGDWNVAGSISAGTNFAVKGYMRGQSAMVTNLQASAGATNYVGADQYGNLIIAATPTGGGGGGSGIATLNGVGTNTTLYRTDGTLIWSAANGALYDTVEGMSLDYEHRVTGDTNFTVSLDWGNRQLQNSSGGIVFDWELEQLIDYASSRVALDWSTRTLNSTDGNPLLTWNVPDGGLPFFTGGVALDAGNVEITNNKPEINLTDSNADADNTKIQLKYDNGTLYWNRMDDNGANVGNPAFLRNDGVFNTASNIYAGGGIYANGFLSFTNDSSTGFTNPAPNEIDLNVNGVENWVATDSTFTFLRTPTYNGALFAYLTNNQTWTGSNIDNGQRWMAGQNYLIGTNWLGGSLTHDGVEYFKFLDHPSVTWTNYATSYRTNNSYSLTQLGSANAWSRTFLMTSNTASTDITNTLPFNVYDFSKTNVVNTYVVPAKSAVEAEIRTDAATNYYLVWKAYPDNPRLRQVATASGYGFLFLDASGNINPTNDLQLATNLPIASIKSPGAIITNGNSFAFTLSNNVTIDATHGLIFDKATNATVGASKVYVNDANSGLTGVSATGSGNVMRTRVGVIRSLEVPMGAWLTNGETTASSFTAFTNSAECYTFANSVTNSEIHIRFALPPTWDAGTVRWQFSMGNTLTNNDANTNVVFGIKAGTLTNTVTGAAEDSITYGTEINFTNHIPRTPFQSIQCTTGDLTIANAAANKDVVFVLRRRNDDATDVNTNTVSVIASRLFYTESTTEPSMPATTQ